MRYSQIFVKTLRHAPKEAETINHKLLSQAGYVDMLMAGVYSYLPLGLIVLRKIEQIVREEMNVISGQELLMPTLHPKDNWVTTGGWDSIDVLFKIKSRTEKEYALGQSEEEIVTPLVMGRVNSYKDLPISVYQIHWKYRDELRAKSGILRGREFFMKDMYSFHENQEDFDKFYNIVKEAYKKIFKRMGLVAKVTEASGGSFSKKISYEFMVLTDAGEDDILYCDSCDYCVNLEVSQGKNEGDMCPRCNNSQLKIARASEVGNVFDLGQKYGKDFEMGFLDRHGKKEYPIMGCYGIGISRAMGVIVEKFNDERGIIWPESVAPFKYYLVLIGKEEDSEPFRQKVKKLVESLGEENILIDDRDKNPGEKYVDADLLGIPYKLVLSINRAEDDIVEYKRREEADKHWHEATIDEVKGKLG